MPYVVSRCLDHEPMYGVFWNCSVQCSIPSEHTHIHTYILLHALLSLAEPHVTTVWCRARHLLTAASVASLGIEKGIGRVLYISQ